MFRWGQLLWLSERRNLAGALPAALLEQTVVVKQFVLVGKRLSWALGPTLRGWRRLHDGVPRKRASCSTVWLVRADGPPWQHDLLRETCGIFPTLRLWCERFGSGAARGSLPWTW